MGVILGLLTGGASKLASYWYLFVIAAAAVLLAVLVWSWDARGKQILTDQLEISTLQANLLTEANLAAEQRQVTDTLTKRLQSKAASAAKIATVKERISNAPSSSDAPASDVLRDAFRGLQQHATSGEGKAAVH